MSNNNPKSSKSVGNTSDPGVSFSHGINFNELESESTMVVSAEEIRQYFYCKRIPYLRHLHRGPIRKTFLQNLGTEYHDKQALLRAKKNAKDVSIISLNPSSKKSSKKKSSKKSGKKGTAGKTGKTCKTGKNGKPHSKDLSIEERKKLAAELGLIDLFDDDMELELPENAGESKPLNFDPEENEEQYFELYLYDKKLEILGIIDYMAYANDEAWPVEIKTGYEPRNKIDNPHKYQLVAQALLIESNFDVLVSKAKIHYVMLNKTKQFNITMHDKLVVIKAVKEIRNSILEECIPPATKFKSICKNCEYFNICGGV